MGVEREGRGGEKERKSFLFPFLLLGSSRNAFEQRCVTKRLVGAQRFLSCQGKVPIHARVPNPAGQDCRKRYSFRTECSSRVLRQSISLRNLRT